MVALLFEGEKTSLFWLGLVILGFSIIVVFSAIWVTTSTYLTYLAQSSQYNTTYPTTIWLSMVPFIFGGAIFILIGAYMMKSGTKKNQSPPQTSNA